jgi:hypothetical protein
MSLAVSWLAGHTVWVLVRIRGWFDGAAGFVAGAIVLFAFALLALLLELQSPESVLWTGTPVAGTERGGIVFYEWAGQQLQFSAPGYGSAKTVIVYLDPSNPSSALLDNNTDRVGPALFVGLPSLAGAGLLIFGGTRGWRWKRRNAKRGEEWWLSRVPPGSGS